VSFLKLLAIKEIKILQFPGENCLNKDYEGIFFNFLIVYIYILFYFILFFWVCHGKGPLESTLEMGKGKKESKEWKEEEGKRVKKKGGKRVGGGRKDRSKRERRKEKNNNLSDNKVIFLIYFLGAWMKFTLHL